jgi:hypothetical protein
MSKQPMRHAFVRAIPEILEEDTLYISTDYVTTSHLCACGCGAEVVLPLHPTKWHFTFDGATVSMAPSIGSRTLPCRSHYLIEQGSIRWANKMTNGDFDRALKRDQLADRQWYERELVPDSVPVADEAPSQSIAPLPLPSSDSDKGANSRRLRVGAFLARFFKRP